jgi:hypothetical protein
MICNFLLFFLLQAESSFLYRIEYSESLGNSYIPSISLATLPMSQTAHPLQVLSIHMSLLLHTIASVLPHHPLLQTDSQQKPFNDADDDDDDDDDHLDMVIIIISPTIAH